MEPCADQPTVQANKDSDVAGKLQEAGQKVGNEEAEQGEEEPQQAMCGICALENCQNADTCGCHQLEAEPVRNNQQLLGFQVRSRHIDWPQYVRPLDTSIRSPGTYLDKQVDFVSGHRQIMDERNRRELLVCHDMMGNYLADRHFHGSQKYDDYRFVHWSAVDYFCYFSHQYVTIPPSGWLNAAHRHGVPVLGTYIVEGDAGSRLLHEVLASEESVQRAVAALTRLCLHFGFEGWLVNVECTVLRQSMPKLYRFVQQLRSSTESQVPHGRVFWYDSVINTGELSWQNELNSRNVQFFRSTHGTLINYTWNDQSLATSASTIRQEKALSHRLYLGLDVFGRGQLGRFQSSHTLSRIAAQGFSAGIFAPAWCFETLQQFGYNIRNAEGDETVNSAFLARNERWWARLWPWLATHPYRALPFYTDFCVGSGRGSYECGTRSAASQPFFNLSRQSLQPSVPLAGNAEHCFHTAFEGGNSLRVLNYDRAFRLFLTDFELSRGVLMLGYAYKKSNEDSLDVVVRLSPFRQSQQELYVFCGSYNGHIVAPGLCYISALDQGLPAKISSEHLPSEQGYLGDNWQVRYYVCKFDGPVRVQDIGLKCRSGEASREECYVGAIYVQSLSLEDWSTVRGQQKAEIDVYARQLWDN